MNLLRLALGRLMLRVALEIEAAEYEDDSDPGDAPDSDRDYSFPNIERRLGLNDSGAFGFAPDPVFPTYLDE